MVYTKRLSKLNVNSYRDEIPAFLTAVEMALIAVKMAFISCVKSPVAFGCLRCSASKNRDIVMQSVSIPVPVLVILNDYVCGL